MDHAKETKGLDLNPTDNNHVESEEKEDSQLATPTSLPSTFLDDDQYQYYSRYHTAIEANDLKTLQDLVSASQSHES